MGAQNTSSGARAAIRTCVACGKSDAKKGLVRFVKSKDGAVSCDESGRAAGRGAYLCSDEECFDKAHERKRLERALKCTLSDAEHEELKKAFKGMCAMREQTT